METKELLTAEMASAISNKKPFTIEQVCDAIKNQAEQGNKFCKFFEIEFSPSLLKHIIDLGYEISANKDPFGILVTKITW